jgi:hypothetical protein
MGQKMTRLVDEQKKCKQIAKRKTRENNNNWPANPYEQFSQSNQVKVTVFHATIMDSKNYETH